MQNLIKPLIIGIIGGGQLGRMMSHAAQNLGYKTVIFCDHHESPAKLTTNQAITADYSDFQALQKFAQKIDIATFEFENIPSQTVEFLNQFKPVYPSADVLKTTQNRLFEKRFLNKIGVDTAQFAAINNLEDLLNNLQIFGKAILKTATLGYDGKGQFVLENQSQAHDVWQKLYPQLNPDNPALILEKFCPFLSEISVIVARSTNGEVACYKPLTNIHKNGILDKSIYPAQISDQTKIKAQQIAINIAKNLDLQGVLAVEFFVMPQEKLLVNELAPRPHNSGHFSMNANNTSQFEQVIRAITGLPLGDTEFHSTGYMKNLIGDEVNNLKDFLANKNAKIHLYDKIGAKIGRKMGHVNILQKP